MSAGRPIARNRTAGAGEFGVVENQIVVSEKRGIAENGENGWKGRRVAQPGSGLRLFRKEWGEESQGQDESQDRARGTPPPLRAWKALERNIYA